LAISLSLEMVGRNREKTRNGIETAGTSSRSVVVVVSQ